MCLAIPGKITKINNHQLTVAYPGIINKALVGDEKVQIGDWVMVQMGVVVKVLSKTEAKQILEAWNDTSN
jgi:hydrogenase expression/formation protein HypC